MKAGGEEVEGRHHGSEVHFQSMPVPLCKVGVQVQVSHEGRGGIQPRERYRPMPARRGRNLGWCG